MEYINPNRLMIDYILMRLRLIKEEINQIKEIVYDMVWDVRHEEMYEDLLNILEKIREEMIIAEEKCQDLFEIEQPWRHVRYRKRYSRRYNKRSQ